MAHVFRAGHSIRLELANGDSPVTEAVFSHYYTPKQGTDTIHHGVPARPGWSCPSPSTKAIVRRR